MLNADLREVIESSKRARDGVFSKELGVKEANAVAANNHNITVAYTRALQERVFLGDTALPPLTLDHEQWGALPAPGEQEAA